MKRGRKLCLLLLVLVVILSMAVAGCGRSTDTPNTQGTTGQIVEVPAATRVQERTPAPSQPQMETSSPSPQIKLQEVPQQYPAGISQGDTVGFSVGGAKDIENFRENIRNGYLPLPTDVTYEGLFYDYYFDTGDSGECRSLFCPAYSAAVSPDPLSGELEYYLAVGLTSGMKESDFERKRLNLVVVLDVSGSMGESFDSYYYDGYGNLVDNREDVGKSKIRIARESVVTLLDQLDYGDRFGMVLFSNSASTLARLEPVEDTNMRGLKDRILSLQDGGATNLSAGMSMATDMLDRYEDVDHSEYENRIIFLTDAMPNLGDFSRDGLASMTERNVDNGIYTTFIGIGVDFNSDLVSSITKIKGANYYSVHSSGEFHTRMGDEFDYMVTPLVFDLRLRIQADGWDIEQVYGSPEADQATGELMRVNTLFPSKRESGETKGGLVLLKLKRTGGDSRLSLRASYQGRTGAPVVNVTDIRLYDSDSEFYANTGIRKGILLSRYADLLKCWMTDERNHTGTSEWEAIISEDTGIVTPGLTRWERQSIDLRVSRPYRHVFSMFSDYFDYEMGKIRDSTLEQEMDILDTLASW